MKLLSVLLYSLVFLTIETIAQSHGCTDKEAINFNSSAQKNDGSCIYEDVSVIPTQSIQLAGVLKETSGLITWNNHLFTHNDNTDIHLYAVDSSNGNNTQKISLNGLKNNDWEEISQDHDYVYIGDFGNNANGNRKNLSILRIDKQSILNNSLQADTIQFSYSDQTDFAPKSTNYTDFDCEAFIVTKDSIYLFTKQWLSNKTSIYTLPKTPGTYTARLKASYDVQGLITGATYLASERLIVLCGYSNFVQPFIYLLYDFQGDDYFGANKRKITVSLPFHQVEGISTTNGLNYYITNECFVKSPFIDTPQKLHRLDLSPFLNNYFKSNILNGTSNKVNESEGVVYPNPSSNLIFVKISHFPLNYILTDILGQPIETGQFREESNLFNMEKLPIGSYQLRLGENHSIVYNLVKQLIYKDRIVN